MTISDLNIGERADIIAVGGEGDVRGHLLSMGFIPGSQLRLVKRAPMGDPLEIMIQGYIISVRKAEIENIEVKRPAPDTSVEKCGRCPMHSMGSCNAALCGAGECAENYRLVGGGEEEAVPNENFAYNSALHEHNSHPGYGEEGRFHKERGGGAHPKDGKLSFALVGQQNCGKTTLFNLLTGLNQRVGNFPGVTVEHKNGVIKGYPQSVITDLPGIYSLSTFTAEEVVSRNFLLHSKPDCIINVVDAGNIERHLYLTIQLMELGIPMVLGLNMMDEVEGNGGSVRVNEMERMLGIPVVPISAARNEGVDELMQHAMHIARYKEAARSVDFCNKHSKRGAAVHRCIHGIMHLIEDHAQMSAIPVRFAAGRVIEGDGAVIDALGLDVNERDMVEHIILQMEQEHGMDRHAAMADMRYAFIRNLCSATVVHPKESREFVRSRNMDKVLTGKLTAIPIFILLFALMLYLTIDVIGSPLQGWLDRIISGAGSYVGQLLHASGVAPAICSLVVDGIFGGIGFVLSFIPIILLLFFFLSMFEDSGYMSRVAFITDKLLRHLGLSGRSIVPLVIGFGCSVPAIMASRTLPSSRDRKMTVHLTPFMSCSAKIPVYSFLAAAFFPGYGGAVMASLYLLSIIVGVIVALISKRIYGKGKTAPFIMELPNYRIPRLSNVAHLLWDKSKDFIHNAFTIILAAMLVIWFLQSFDFHFNFIAGGDGSQSILAYLSGVIAPVFAPLGLGDWRVVTALVSGFMAKEGVVSTLELLGATSCLTPVTAVPMLVFCLLYTPCIAAITAVKREFGFKWALYLIFFQCSVAWVVAFAAYHIALLF